MTIQFQLDFQDLLAMQKNVINHSRTHEVKGNYFKWGISIFILIAFLFINISFISLIIGLVIAGAFFLIAPTLYPKIAFARLKSNFEQNDYSKLLKPCDMHFSDEGIDRVINGETTHFPWDGFRYMKEDEARYFLYVDDLQGIVIPKQPTVIDGDVATFQERIISYAEETSE